MWESSPGPQPMTVQMEQQNLNVFQLLFEAGVQKQLLSVRQAPEGVIFLLEPNEAPWKCLCSPHEVQALPPARTQLLRGQ